MTCFQLVRINPSGGDLTLASKMDSSHFCFQLVRINPSGGKIFITHIKEYTSFQLVRINPSGGVRLLSDYWEHGDEVSN